MTAPPSPMLPVLPTFLRGVELAFANRARLLAIQVAASLTIVAYKLAFPGRLFTEEGSVLALVPLLLLSAASVPVAQHAALAAARGSPVRLSTIARAALSRLPAFLLLGALLALQALLIGLVCIAAALVGGLLLAALVGAPLLSFAFVLNIFALPVWAAEGLGAVASIERSATLTRGVRWRILALILLSAASGSALRWLAGGWAGAGVTGLTFGTLGQCAAEALAGAITIGVATAAYCQVMACTGAGAVPASLDRADAPSSSMQKSWMPLKNSGPPWS